MISPGDFVRCAVTGEPIMLPDLRYWSVELQEAYATTEVSDAAISARCASGLRAESEESFSTAAAVDAAAMLTCSAASISELRRSRSRASNVISIGSVRACSASSASAGSPVSLTKSFSVVTSCAPSGPRERHELFPRRRARKAWSSGKDTPPGLPPSSRASGRSAADWRCRRRRRAASAESRTCRRAARGVHETGPGKPRFSTASTLRSSACVRRIAHDNGVDEAELELQRCTQRAGGDDLAVADARACRRPAAMDRSLASGRVLQAVVHDDDAWVAAARLDGDGRRRAGRAPRRSVRRREQQRLVAVQLPLPRRVIDPSRARAAAAIAARQEHGPLAARDQRLGDETATAASCRCRRR